MAKSALDLIQEIGEIVKGVWGQSENPEGLSKALNDLSVLNWALGQWQAQFDEDERQAKAELDLDKANLMQEFVGLNAEPVNKAEIRVTIKVAPKRKAYNELASGLEKIKITMRANDKVMDAVRSRLSLIKGNIQ